MLGAGGLSVKALAVALRGTPPSPPSSGLHSLCLGSSPWGSLLGEAGPRALPCFPTCAGPCQSPGVGCWGAPAKPSLPTGPSSPGQPCPVLPASAPGSSWQVPGQGASRSVILSPEGLSQSGCCRGAAPQSPPRGPRQEWLTGGLVLCGRRLLPRGPALWCYCYESLPLWGDFLCPSWWV